jgi:hypothetical protein
MLTKEEILMVLKLLAEETIVKPTKAFPFRISCDSRAGYSGDKRVGALQAKLSIMLEMAGDE